MLSLFPSLSSPISFHSHHFPMRLLLLLIVASSTAAENPIDLGTLFSAGVSPCISPCLSDLIHATRELLYFKDTVAHFHSLCSTYENATLCVAEAEVSCGKTSSFALNAHPVTIMCNRKSDALAPLLPCVEKNVDGLLNVCDSSCLFTSSLSEVSRRESVQQMAENGGDNRFSLVTELSTLCPSASCMISCLSKSLNAACPPAGDDIIGALLRPFHVYAEMLETNEDMKNIVFKAAPPTCYPFLLEDGLEKMQAGEYAKEKKSSEEESVLSGHRSIGDDEDYFHDLPSAEETRGSISTLLSASGIPSCSDACLSDLLIAASKLFDFNNTIDNFQQLCSTYDNASLCVATQEIQCIHEASFSVGVSGLEEICNTKHEEFVRHTSCLRPHIDSSLSNCDSSCSLTSSFSSLISSDFIGDATHTEDRATLYQELSPVCPAMGCMISCIARSLNRDCAPAGTEIAEALLRPFVRASELLIDMGPESIDAIQSVVPSTCHMFVSLTDLADMMQGVESPLWGSPTTSTAVVDQNETPQVEDIAIVEDVQQTHAPDTVVEEIKMGDGNMQSMGEEDDDERRDENWGRPGQSSPLSDSPSPSSSDPSDRLLESDLVHLPECQRGCATDLAETYGVLLKMGGTHVERYQTVCTKYVSSRECVSHCPDPMKLFETLTSGIAYMCNEQNEAFNATIECVDASSSDVQRECDQTCNTQAVMFKWFMEGMHRMSEHGGAAGLGGHGGGGGLLNMFSGLGGMRADDGDEPTRSDLVAPSSVGRIRREVSPDGQSRGLFDKSGPLSFLNGADKSISATGTQANAVLDTVQRSINAFSQPKNSPLFPSSNQPLGKSGGGSHSSFPSSFNGLGGHSEMSSTLDLNTMRDFTSDACQVSECFLSCVKNKMNARCDGTAGSLLSEVFMRPFARAQEQLSAVPMAGSMFGFLLPQQCRFLYDTNRMADYRMDSSLDEDLKRTYREKKEEQAKLDSESVMPTALAEHISPFDSDQNLDELSEEYGRMSIDSNVVAVAHLYNGDDTEEKAADPPVDTVIFNGPIRKADRSMTDYDGSGEGSGEDGSGSRMEIEEGSGEEEIFSFEFQSPSNGELQCLRV
ncbi:hypothetical protein PRIPAC_70337 [Pristionchus pacificus]|uniref:Uncharacterized protein n=1 Tax=Pristionchus pacificus TaxID=54126 RepID=A0A2A6CA66_PRIPA|nr:hypothetical protein PRIPAC_70337 [Pristionchus pacificus]|eukprot:PDM75039.1 hypothetical protein PRIPAC_40420 [Pristionchus pacificus]